MTDEIVKTGMLTEEQFKRVLPKHVKVKVTKQMVDTINSITDDPIVAEQYRDNLLSFTSVMQDGKFKISSYIDAVRYVSFKLMGASNIEAYTKTFPDRFQRLIAEGQDDKAISSYVAAYNKNILVNKVLEQTLIPVHVLNMHTYQEAINVQATLMKTANSEKVRTDAANSILTQLKPPETKKIELDIGMKQDKTIEELRQATMELVEMQKAKLVSGDMSPKEIAHSSLFNQNNISDAEIIPEETALETEQRLEAQTIEYEKITRPA